MGRKTGKPAAPDRGERRVKKTFVLREDSAQRLASFAGRYSLRESAVVELALTNYLAGFRAFGGPLDKPESPTIRIVDEPGEAARETA